MNLTATKMIRQCAMYVIILGTNVMATLENKYVLYTVNVLQPECVATRWTAVSEILHG